MLELIKQKPKTPIDQSGETHINTKVKNKKNQKEIFKLPITKLYRDYTTSIIKSP